jgi:HK97 gp10 family phage protein
MVTVKINGLDQIQRALEQIPKVVADKAIRGGLRKGAESLRERIAANAPRESGFLANHFNVKVRVMHNELAASAFVGPASKTYYPNIGDRRVGVSTGKHGQKGGALPVASVARFMEFGTSKMAARPFIRPAFESMKEAILDTVVKSIQEAIAKWRS